MFLNKSERFELETTWNGRTIRYSVIRAVRKSLTITVYRDRRVLVRAPAKQPIDEIVEYVQGKRAWIVRHLAKFEALPPDDQPRYESGEKHLYLGEPYQLRVESSKQRGVALESGQLLVHVRPATGPRAVRMALRRWYTDRARTVFEDSLSRLQRETPLFANLRCTLRIRRMTSRWGSCTSRGVITMNPLLIQASPACVDYVIAHELAHRLELNHSPRFYAIMDAVMPDWKMRQDELKRTPVLTT